MPITLFDAKEYLRITDFTDDDTLIETMIDTAIITVKNATGVDLENLSSTQLDADKLGNLVCLMLVAHWYDNREIFTTKTKVNNLPYSVSTILQQISFYHEEIDENNTT